MVVRNDPRHLFDMRGHHAATLVRHSIEYVTHIHHVSHLRNMRETCAKRA